MRPRRPSRPTRFRSLRRASGDSSTAPGSTDGPKSEIARCQKYCSSVTKPTAGAATGDIRFLSILRHPCGCRTNAAFQAGAQRNVCLFYNNVLWRVASVYVAVKSQLDNSLALSRAKRSRCTRVHISCFAGA
jgi:hypothetical protein